MKIKPALLALAAVLSFTTCLISAGEAATILYSNLDGGTGYDGSQLYAVWGIGNLFVTGHYSSIGASFTATSDATLLSIDMGLTYPGIEPVSGRSCVIKLEGNNPATSLPNGLVLASGTVVTTVANGSPVSLTTFTLTGAPVALNNGVKYWVVVEPGSVASTNGWAMVAATGVLATSDSGTNYGALSGRLPSLQVNGTPTPEPASAALLGLGTLLLAARRRRV